MISLPSVIPIFPLPNLVLFPEVTTPLHIFEPRYRAMVADAYKGDKVIGMVLLKPGWEADYYGYPEIYSLGCAGKITKLEALPDGRFNILLAGFAEFRVQAEIRDRPYRQARVDWCPSTLGTGTYSAESFDYEEIREFLAYLMEGELEQLWSTLTDYNLSDQQIVNFLCFYLDFTPLEKQALLEALNDRTRYLHDLLAFKVEERKAGKGKQGGGSIPPQ